MGESQHFRHIMNVLTGLLLWILMRASYAPASAQVIAARGACTPPRS
jgi:hypothetical protein